MMCLGCVVQCGIIRHSTWWCVVFCNMCFIQYDVLRCGIFWYYVVCGILCCMFCVVSMSNYTCLRVWCAV